MKHRMHTLFGNCRIFALLLILPLAACQNNDPVTTPPPPGGGSDREATVIFQLGDCYNPEPPQFTEIQVFQVNTSTVALERWGDVYTSSANGGNHEITVPGEGDFSFNVRVELEDFNDFCCPEEGQQDAILTHEHPLGTFQPTYSIPLAKSFCK